MTERPTIQAIMPKLQKCRPSNGGYTACCPSHEDRSPSFFMKLMPSGYIFVKCYVGCTRGQILEALGFSYQKRIAPAFRPIIRKPDEPLNFEPVLSACLSTTTTKRIESLSVALGVSSASIVRLGARYDAERALWYFPMKSALGRTIGIRVRNEAGSKWSLTGSRGGLFVPEPFGRPKQIFIVEGPSELAALLDLGFCGIGRPSCNSGTELVMDFLREYPRCDAIIFSNRDSEHQRKDGTTFRPGQDGAVELANKIDRPVKIILPPAHKDLREWVRAGATREDVEFLLQNTLWHRKPAKQNDAVLRSVGPTGNRRANGASGNVLLGDADTSSQLVTHMPQ